MSLSSFTSNLPKKPTEQPVLGEGDSAPWPIVKAGEITATFKQGKHCLFHGSLHSDFIVTQSARVDPADQSYIGPETATERCVIHFRAGNVAYPQTVNAGLDKRRQERAQVTSSGAEDTEGHIERVQLVQNLPVPGDCEAFEHGRGDYGSGVGGDGFIKGGVVDRDP